MEIVQDYIGHLGQNWDIYTAYARNNTEGEHWRCGKAVALHHWDHGPSPENSLFQKCNLNLSIN
jgi:hypothetical protein